MTEAPRRRLLSFVAVDLAPVVTRSSFAILCNAVLASAMDDLTGKSLPQRAVAVRWLKGAPAPITFHAACEALALDPAATRARLLASSRGRPKIRLLKVQRRRAA